MNQGLKMMMVVFVTMMILKTSYAQNNWRMGFAANAGLATNNVYGFVLGADVRLQKGIGDNTSFILTSGVTHFFDTQKTVDGFTYIPVKAGLKTFVAEKLYVAGEVGAGFGLNKGSDPSFLWSPAIGYSFKSIDVSVKYEDFTEGTYTKQVALRIAYGFKL